MLLSRHYEKHQARSRQEPIVETSLYQLSSICWARRGLKEDKRKWAIQGVLGWGSWIWSWFTWSAFQQFALGAVLNTVPTLSRQAVPVCISPCTRSCTWLPHSFLVIWTCPTDAPCSCYYRALSRIGSYLQTLRAKCYYHSWISFGDLDEMTETF